MFYSLESLCDWCGVCSMCVMLAHACVGVHACAWTCEGRRKSLGVSFASRALFPCSFPEPCPRSTGHFRSGFTAPGVDFIPLLLWFKASVCSQLISYLCGELQLEMCSVWTGGEERDAVGAVPKLLLPGCALPGQGVRTPGLFHPFIPASSLSSGFL